ncbi:MAG: PLP-dependent aspartate aminotransferase family protein [Clostridiales bacterium]|jgi:cystathionine gamma-synthase|nr:PLP-dependent aspartate aminotransferase family protein [Clostridiales bacterium]
MKKETVCVHGAGDYGFDDPTGAVCVPIYQSATFKHKGLNKSTGFDYSRLSNPTRLAVEKTVAALEGGAGASAFSTGMAAISALCEIFSPGDGIVASHDLYGGAIRLFRNISQKNGLTVDFADTSDLDAVRAAIKPNTRAVFIETPTNPMMLVSDVEAIAKIAKPLGILTIVDNTFLTPYFFKPLSLGADIVVHSGTKFLCGHNDTLAGFLASATAELAEKFITVEKTTGACLSPFDSFLVLRGIKTLGLRMERGQQNAFEIAKFLSAHPRVKKVYYAGLESNGGYEILKRQAEGFGCMISFEVDSVETVERVLGGVKLIAFAESLGGAETLVTYPAVQTHADVPKNERDARGINDRLLRLSVGIENAGDLIEDLAAALGR